MEVKLITCSNGTESTEVFKDEDFAHLMIAVANMLDLNVYEVIVKKK